MVKKINYSANKSLGDEIEILCVKCTGETSHEVIASSEIVGSEGNDHYSFDWNKDYQIIKCNGCKTFSFRETSSNSEDYDHDEDGNFEYNVSEKLYPSRIDGVKGLGDEIYLLPVNVQRIYSETLNALSNQSPLLTAIGLRALVEVVCKEKNASGKDLFLKIDDLVTKKILTPFGSEILHKIRSLGNDAAHEVKPHSEKQLALAMDIVDHLLKEVYILPVQVASAFQEKK